MKKFIAPEMDHDTTAYWQHLKEHEVRLQKCTECRRFRFPPYPNCPHCGALGGDWEAISGKGSLYSWTVVHHPIDPRLKDEVPFVLALVQMEEGPRIVGRLIGCNSKQLKADMPVKVRYDDVDSDLTLLNFEP
jgi:uncharacterized OB-fold protein